MPRNVSNAELQQQKMLVAKLVTTKARLIMDLAAGKDQIVGNSEEKCTECSLNVFQPDGYSCYTLH